MNHRKKINSALVSNAAALIVALVFSVNLAFANEPTNSRSVVFLNAAVDTTAQPASAALNLGSKEFTSRRETALLYSCILPGSGQTMLGHTYKGVSFSLVAFSSVLTAVISHNNFVARNERMDALEFQYHTTTTWISADRIYNEMNGTLTKLRQDKNKRDAFIVVSAVVWIANIVDVLYNTEDEGQTLFSVGTPHHDIVVPAPTVAAQQQLLTFSFPLE